MTRNIKTFLTQKGSLLINAYRHVYESIQKILFPKGLLHRFLLIILAPMLLLQAIVLVFFFDRHWDTVRYRLARDVAGEIGTIAALIQDDYLRPEEIGPVIGALNEKLSLQLSFESHRSIPPTLPTKDPRTIRALASEIKALGYPFIIRETNDQQAAITVQLDTGLLHALVPRKRFFSSTVYVFLIWMFGFSILLFWIAFLFMKNQVRSIERLSRAAELFGRGQTVDSFKPEGATEVRQAGVSFIQMRNRIQRYLTERTGMLSGVSHDLRTPLTRMKLQLSMMEQTEAIEDLQKDVSDMEHMLEAYLSFARGEGKEHPEQVALNTLLQDLIDKSVKAGQQIDFHQECLVRCICRPNELARAVTNLLTNAARYAKHTQITVGTHRHMARIIVDDDGPGIPSDKRTDVFRAFYRLEKSRNTHTGGIGLGLTITRDIILSHGGSIDLSDSPIGGLRVTITLPLAGRTREGKQI